MEQLIDIIETRSQKLSENPFCKWMLKETTELKEETFAFTPAMLYFILGFRDILSHLQYASPQSEIEHIINTHCEEDKNHWMWYLQDLKTLGFNDSSWGADWSDLVKNLWSDENKPTRDLVYLCIHAIKKHNDPRASLVIIECLESTFGVFMTTLKTRFSGSYLYKKLQFFGQNHQEQEMNHSLGHWIEDDNQAPDMDHSEKDYLLKIKISDAETVAFADTINLIYDQFEKVFETWLNNRNFYKTNLNKPISIDLKNKSDFFVEQ